MASQTTQNNWPVVGMGNTHFEAIKNCLREVKLATNNPVDDTDEE